MLRGVAAAVLVGAAVVSTAAAAPERDALVRPGVGIGRISIGSTQAQVVQILGPHHRVNRRYPIGFGRIHVEHDWDYGRWTVAYEGRPGRLEVVKVATMLQTQRTPQRIGVGSRPRDLARAYPSGRCVERQRTDRATSVGRFYVVRARNGRLTSFLIATPWYGQDRRHRVVEVIVSTRARGRNERDWPCAPGWQTE